MWSNVEIVAKYKKSTGQYSGQIRPPLLGKEMKHFPTSLFSEISYFCLILSQSSHFSTFGKVKLKIFGTLCQLGSKLIWIPPHPPACEKWGTKAGILGLGKETGFVARILTSEKSRVLTTIACLENWIPPGHEKNRSWTSSGPEGLNLWGLSLSMKGVCFWDAERP